MPNWIDAIRRFYTSGGTMRREAIIAGGAMLFGLIAMPVLVWLAGQFSLGTYAHGGVFAILQMLRVWVLATWVGCHSHHAANDAPLNHSVRREHPLCNSPVAVSPVAVRPGLMKDLICSH